MKWNIVNLSATVIFGVVSVVGLIYNLWPGTNPYFMVAGVYVSEDLITLGLVLLGAVALSILLMLVGKLLWPAVRRRLKTRRKRFMELAPELRELQHITINSFGEHSMPRPGHYIRSHLLLEQLADLGIDLSTPVERASSLSTWRNLERCFEILAVLAAEGRLDAAKETAEAFEDAIEKDLER